MARRNEEIDAGAEFEEQERGASDLSRHKRANPPGARMLLWFCVAAACGVLFFVGWKWLELRQAQTQEEQVAESPRGLNKSGADWKPANPRPADQPQRDDDEPEQERPANTQATAVMPPANQGTAPATEEGPSQEDLIRQRRLGSGLQDRQDGQGQPNTHDTGEVAKVPPQEGGELAKQMKPTRLNAAKASVMRNRDLMLTQGQMIDCQLETKIVSTIAGMTSCYITRNVMSTNKRVVLLDKGSRVVGQFQGGMTQGQARIFVLWTRVETPNGVIIDLDSPGSGELGESGVGGWIDTHLGERFAGAVFLSLIGDVGQWLTRSNNGNSGDNSITFDNTAQGSEEMAAEALRNSINIPPTLYKNQGERVSIFVARDLDFTGVYDLERQ